jgi:hypothetical protein
MAAWRADVAISESVRRGGLNDAWYITVPLEATYNDAYATMPRRWRDLIEGAPAR